MLNKCSQCAYFCTRKNKQEADSCYVEPGKRYIVWGERPACACFKSKVEAEREEEARRLRQKLEE